MKSIDKYRGCLIGGAAGDALGYAVEFLSEGMIFSRYGESGITEYELTNGVAQISDDTQMSLFTANGLLYAAAHAMTENFAGCIELCYKDWLKTQRESYPVDAEKCCSWLMNEQRLFSRRAPGVTCMSALSAKKCGTMAEPINDSKGCASWSSAGKKTTPAPHSLPVPYDPPRTAADGRYCRPHGRFFPLFSEAPQ